MASDWDDYTRELDRKEPKPSPERREEIRRKIWRQYGGDHETQCAGPSLEQFGGPNIKQSVGPNYGQSVGPNLGRGPWCCRCGEEKRTDNHWFESQSDGVSIVVQPLAAGPSAGWRPLCGEACVQKEMADYLNGQLSGLGA